MDKHFSLLLTLSRAVLQQQCWHFSSCELVNSNQYRYISTIGRRYDNQAQSQKGHNFIW